MGIQCLCTQHPGLNDETWCQLDICYTEEAEVGLFGRKLEGSHLTNNSLLFYFNKENETIMLKACLVH